MYLNLVNGLYLFLDENERSCGLYADPFYISVWDHDVEVHVVSDQSIYDEVVVFLHAEMVKRLHALADCLGDGYNELSLVIE